MPTIVRAATGRGLRCTMLRASEALLRRGRKGHLCLGRTSHMVPPCGRQKGWLSPRLRPARSRRLGERAGTDPGHSRAAPASPTKAPRWPTEASAGGTAARFLATSCWTIRSARCMASTGRRAGGAGSPWSPRKACNPRPGTARRQPVTKEVPLYHPYPHTDLPGPSGSHCS